MDIKRRAILKAMGGVAASLSIPFQLIPGSSYAAFDTPQARQRKLVVIQLKGGNDGLNTVMPSEGEQNGFYEALRPIIKIPREEILPWGEAPLLNGQGTTVPLGLHPALAGLQPLKEKLAIFPATHTGERSDTSHFFQFNFLDSGFFVGNLNVDDQRGWAGRFLQSRNPNAKGIVSFDFGSQRTLLHSELPSVSLANPASLALGTRTALIADEMAKDLAAAAKDLEPGYALDYAKTQANFFGNVLPRLNERVNFDRVPVLDPNAPNKTYPVGGKGLATRLKRTADMLLGLPELEVVHMEFGSFDTHKNQITPGKPATSTEPETPANPLTGDHANLLKELGDSLAAFYADLENANANLLSNVAVVVMSEFGRTADSNGNHGTDHGQAGTWFVLGGSVKGGIYGDYPGLAEQQLVSSNKRNLAKRAQQRFWLQQTVDYRDILSDLLGSKFLGGTPDQVNAAFQYIRPLDAKPIGFV